MTHCIYARVAGPALRMFFYEEKKNYSYYYYLSSSSSSSSSSLNKYRGNQTSDRRQKGRSFGPRTPDWFSHLRCRLFLPLSLFLSNLTPTHQKCVLLLRLFETDKCVTHMRKRFLHATMEDAPASHGASSTTRTPPPPSVPSSSRKWPRFWSGSKPTGRKRGRRRRKRWHGSISTDSSPRIPAVFYPGEDGDVPAVQTARTTGKRTNSGVEGRRRRLLCSIFAARGVLC